TRRNPAHDARYLQVLIAMEGVGQIVHSLPVLLDGREGEKAVEARAYGQWLIEVTGLPLVFWDERYTTLEAKRKLLEAKVPSKRRKARLDQAAAQILLQSYLDAGCPDEPTLGPLDG